MLQRLMIGHARSVVSPLRTLPRSAPRAANRAAAKMDAAAIAATMPPRRAPAAPEKFKWTPKQSASYLTTYFVVTWLGAFLVTFLLVQVLLRMS